MCFGIRGIFFLNKYPKVQFSLYTNSAEYIKERLEQGLLDFGFLLESVDVTKFDYICMKKKERWGLLLRAGHPLAKKESITKEDLLGEPLITTNRQSIQKELESWLERPLSQLDIFATYNIITNVVMLVESGVASALTIEGAVKNISIGHIKERCIKYKHRTGIQKVYLGFMLIFFARVKEH